MNIEKDFDEKFKFLKSSIGFNILYYYKNGGIEEAKEEQLKQFISKKISEAEKSRDKYWKEKIKKAITKKKHCELCDFPAPECSCRGYNSAIRDFKNNFNK